MSSAGPSSSVGAVLEWSEGRLRDLPWRRSRDPWAILVAEIMLQQTQVARVIDRWAPFLERFPDPPACAEVAPAEILRAWRGLGYNRRALMLHRAAAVVVERHDGVVPSALEDLLALPGVGPYTARAVRAFAFEQPAAPVDTNVGRVLARLFGRPLRSREAQEIADGFAPDDDVWRYNQAVMELGAVVCTKRSPGCDRCPLSAQCAWRGSGVDPAVGSAGVAGPQSRFEGSDRQLRGRLVDRLRVVPLPQSELVAFVAGTKMPQADPARLDRVVAELVREGMIEQVDGALRLVGDEVRRGPSVRR